MTDLFLDSGAPTIYNTFIRKITKNKYTFITGNTFEDRKDDDFSFIKTQEYLTYRNTYLEFLKVHHKKFKLYVNLDIINNPEATWDNQKWFESHGLKPLPVFHFGCDIKWLEKYIKAGYDYIGLGGLFPNPFTKLKEPLDEMWMKYICDRKGYPKIKLHGFAVTSPRLLYRYPWFSCDSTSWVKLGLFGCITVPKIKYGKPDFKTFPMVLFVSKRTSSEYRKNCKHIESMSKYEKSVIEGYLKSKGFVLGKSEIVRKPFDYKAKKDENVFKRINDYSLVEVVQERGVSNDNLQRDTFNAVYYKDLADSLPKWPWPIRFANNRGLF